MALYDLAENCDYGHMREEMIRDRLVVGIRDNALSEKLQLEAKLTLWRQRRLQFARRKLCASSSKH